jgi:signal transduction histidine kinase
MDKAKGAVLFVDDEEKILKALRRTLREEPYQCLFALGGHEALDILDTHPIHVMVTDMYMPGMSGEELLQHLQVHFPQVIRLILSAKSDSGSLLKAINTGQIYRFIVKPWDDGELKIVVRQALEYALIQEEKRHLSEQLEAQNRLLEEMVEQRSQQLLNIQGQAEIGKYVSQIVHNLKNPLHAIFGTLDLAELILTQDKEINKAKLAEIIIDARKSADHLNQIVGGILVHGKTDHRMQLMPVDLNAVIEEEVVFFEIDPLFRKKIEKKLVLEPDLPPILGDAVQIKQIIDNLLANAASAMTHTEIKKLTIKTAYYQDSVFMKIEDTGEGIETENLAGIFNPYFSTKLSDQGTGLGLASVKAMVEAYKGRIDVQSEKGKGTTFTLQLPTVRHVMKEKTPLIKTG